MPSREVENIRFIAVLLMTVVHIPGIDVHVHSATVDIWSAPLLDLLGLFIVDGLSRISSPLLGLLSGYFAIRKLEHTKAATFIQSRFRSLVVPAVAWSAVFLVLKAIQDLASNDVRGLEQAFTDHGVDLLLGIFHWPINFPLHYLVDLFKSALVLAAIHAALRWTAHRTQRATPDTAVYLAVAGIGGAVLTFVTLDPTSPVQPGLNQDSLLMRSDLFLFFFLGCALRASGRDLVEWIRSVSERCSAPRLLSISLLFIVGAMSWNKLLEFHEPWLTVAGGILNLVTRGLGSIVLLVAIVRFTRPLDRLGLSSSLAFRLFCTHAIVYTFASGIISWRSPGDHGPGFWLGETIVLTVMAVLVAWVTLALQRSSPMRHVRI